MQILKKIKSKQGLMMLKTIYPKAMKLTLLSFLMLCLIGCGSKTQVLTKIQIQKVQIPNKV